MNYKRPLALLTILFFMMGFITCLNDILVPFLKSVFNLDYSQASLVQMSFFGAYGLASIPASKLIERIGYHKGIILGFFTASLGCLLFYPAVSIHNYYIFLVALFILAIGVVILQVAGNPFVAALGDPETASSRLTMTQAFNSLGTFLAPFFGSYFILKDLTESSNAGNVKIPYLFIALSLIVIALILSRISFPSIQMNQEKNSWKETLSNNRLVLGMLGIFFYVGAEVAIGTFLINFAMEAITITEAEAASLVALYWGGAMAGRFLGIFTLKYYKPGNVLSVHAVLSVVLIFVSIKSTGLFSVYSLILVGLCNSIMFPTIFTLALKGLKSTETASGLLATCIIGGAFIPYLTGKVADDHGLRVAFYLPIICYAYIVFYGRNFERFKIK